jgi:hypothetical protein
MGDAVGLRVVVGIGGVWVAVTVGGASVALGSGEAVSLGGAVSVGRGVNDGVAVSGMSVGMPGGSGVFSLIIACGVG